MNKRKDIEKKSAGRITKFAPNFISATTHPDSPVSGKDVFDQMCINLARMCGAVCEGTNSEVIYMAPKRKDRRPFGVSIKEFCNYLDEHYEPVPDHGKEHPIPRKKGGGFSVCRSKLHYFKNTMDALQKFMNDYAKSHPGLDVLVKMLQLSVPVTTNVVEFATHPMVTTNRDGASD